MARDEVRVVVLFEDAAHRSFLTRLVDHLGLRPVRFVLCVDCNGVMRQFAAELAAMRPMMRFQPNLALLVCIDADEHGHAGRLRQLEACIAANGGARTAHDRIACLVPALEIENWYVHLCVPAARPIDESRDYKPSPEWRALAKDLGRAAKDAARAWPSQPHQDPPALAAARVELKRL